MKYSEVHRKLRKAGCYSLDYDIAGDPAWYSPITDRIFTTSHHGTQEAKRGTLKAISKASGVRL